MTRQAEHPLICTRCGATVPRASKFSEWLRRLPPPNDSREVSNQNLDYVWHRYRDGWLLTIEEKTRGGTSPFAQKDTHSQLEQLLAAGSGSMIRTPRGQRPVEYRGHYVVSFANELPTDGPMTINGRPAEIWQLLDLLERGHLREAAA